MCFCFFFFFYFFFFFFLLYFVFFCFFFFLIIRRPPRSTLFPYTNALPIFRPLLAGSPCHPRVESVANMRKTEEHTSELQSHSDLVCRLLLEKKKKTTQ